MDPKRPILDSFDLMSSDHFHVILHPDKKHGLIFNRLDGTIDTINYDDAKELSNLRRVSRAHGIIGKYLNKYLVLVKNRTLVGSLYDPITKQEHDIYVINQIQVVDITCNQPSITDTRQSSVLYDVGFSRRAEEEVFTKENLKEVENSTSDKSDLHDFTSLPITISSSSYASSHSRSTPWNPFKLANSLKPKIPTHLLRSSFVDPSINSSGSSLATSSIQSEDSDKRLVDEMTKLFNNTNSFFFSPTLDITSRLSKLFSDKQFNREHIWKTANNKFFWNRHMLKDLLKISNTNSDVNYFICVIIQGFIAIQKQVKTPRHLSDPMIDSCLPATSIDAVKVYDNLESFERSSSGSSSDKYCDETSKVYQLALISRRSVYHAGTRYRRRGCDEQGYSANFVETEQIFRYNKHFTSFVIIRGSIPLYWYQTGYNYRPPPIICRSESKNQEVFKKHFSHLFNSYGTEQIVVVDCTEQSGREKALHDAYKKHLKVLKEDKPKLELIEFDFHKHCKGRQCSDSQVERHLKSCGLTDQLLKDVRYYWNDGEVIWDQVGVFRVNCLDCSDRTNVVQRAISLQILDLQLARLGLITPDTNPAENDSRRIMRIMWATNGNVLSTQYCGTRALFGTADRKLASYLQDTYSSASRYYMSKFRDAYRQAAIDAMLGVGDAASNLKPPDQCEDNYELINFEHLSPSRGGALLKDVGSKVTSKLSRLTERFNIKPNNEEITQPVPHPHDDFDDPDLMAAKLDDEILANLNIDWPSSESADIETGTNQSMFAVMSKEEEEDNFQDDEFSQLMLSIDLTDIQKLREGNEFVKPNEPTRSSVRTEQIDMTQATGTKTSSSNTLKDLTSTTST